MPCRSTGYVQTTRAFSRLVPTLSLDDDIALPLRPQIPEALHENESVLRNKLDRRCTAGAITHVCLVACEGDDCRHDEDVDEG
jgi:hypothetical protein